jgi:hypothetical protein
VDHDEDSNETQEGVSAGRSLLDEIVRDGARQMLAAALQAEVDTYIEQFADQVDECGHRLVVRNGYHAARDALTATGAAVTVNASSGPVEHWVHLRTTNRANLLLRQCVCGRR